MTTPVKSIPVYPANENDDPSAPANDLAVDDITSRQLECLAWVQEGKSGGDDGYAREELVAELGAAFLCADLGLELTPRPDHASYIASWLEVLKDDRRFIFSAAAHAQRACDFLKARAHPTASAA